MFEQIMERAAKEGFLGALKDFWNSAIIKDIPVRVSELRISEVSEDCNEITVHLPVTLDQFFDVMQSDQQTFGDAVKKNHITISATVPFGQFLEKIAPERVHFSSFFRGYATVDDRPNRSHKRNENLLGILQHLQDLTVGAKGRPRKMVFRMLQHPEFFPEPVCAGIVSDSFVSIPDTAIIDVLLSFPEFENYEVVHPTFSEWGTRFGLQLTSEKYTEKIANVGDIVSVCVWVTNSEWGNRAFTVQVGAYVLECTNGMISPHATHVLKFPHRKRQKMSAAQTRDEIFLELLSGMAEMVEDSAKMYEDFNRSVGIDAGNVYHQIAQICHENALGMKYVDGVSATWGIHAMGRSTLWDVANAFTRFANDIKSEDIKEKLWRLGGEIVTWEKPREITIEIEDYKKEDED